VRLWVWLVLTISITLSGVVIHGDTRIFSGMLKQKMRFRIISLKWQKPCDFGNCRLL
jgi:hypothetical protein